MVLSVSHGTTTNFIDIKTRAGCDIRSPAVPPPLLVSFSVPVPGSLALPLAPCSSSLPFPLALTLTPAADHCLRSP